MPSSCKEAARAESEEPLISRQCAMVMWFNTDAQLVWAISLLMQKQRRKELCKLLVLLL